jgi:hypothetical protein
MMNIADARAYAKHARANRGRLLRLGLHGGAEFKKNTDDLKRLYGMYPEIKPVRCKQLSLNLK